MDSMLNSSKTAVLALADGSFFLAKVFGYQPKDGYVLAECVFNTAMTGYQEIISDPSYSGQAVCFTNPHIGNTGINSKDSESSSPRIAALIIANLSTITSNWRSEQSLEQYCISKQIFGIRDIDTRALTHCLREKGAQPCCIMLGDDVDRALALARSHSTLHGVNLCVSAPDAKVQKHPWKSCSLLESTTHKNNKKIAVIDYGVKQQMLCYLVDLGCEVEVYPANVSAAEIKKSNPDGIVLSNGPGDPSACTEQIETVKQLLKTDIAIFGICLGCQLLGLALGAKTYKLVFGHHGANHPILDHATGKVLITSQNHGFSISKYGLPAEIVVTHTSLFDDSIQGFKHREKPIMAVQGHPEASPGPLDWRGMFEHFLGQIDNAKA
ncbi:MAG: glutamine-hydrolyzing carbamoyl-phosphate synthase small subunit [Candidatus Thioglobus sp.]